MKKIQFFSCFLLNFLFVHPIFAADKADIETGAVKSEISGSFPHIFEHYKAMPVFYDFEKMPVEKITDKISRQYIYAGQSMLVKWIFKKGAKVPLHHHVNEQITWITQGKVAVYSQNEKFIVGPGQVIVFPPHVPHEFIALEDTIDIDFFTPVREDWINQTAGYLKNLPGK